MDIRPMAARGNAVPESSLCVEENSLVEKNESPEHDCGWTLDNHTRWKHTWSWHNRASGVRLPLKGRTEDWREKQKDPELVNTSNQAKKENSRDMWVRLSNLWRYELKVPLCRDVAT